MLIGAHVSTAGGLVKAWERAAELGCDAIQVFNQSPRMWRPTQWKDDDVAEFRERMADGPIESVTIHAVYLINGATKDREMRRKSLASLTHSLRMGDAIGADGVVFHPGSTVGEPHGASMKRAAQAIKQVLDDSDRCPLLLEDTAGAGNTLGRTFEELAELIDLAGGQKRIGVCLDCCHMYASGYDIRDADKLAAVVDELESATGLDRLHCLHVNDCASELGSNRDRHAFLPEGELAERGLAAFLSEPRFEGLPALLEGAGQAPDAAQIKIAKDLRKRGLRSRARRGGRTKPARSRGRRRSAGSRS
jgi:deoxyribonuclease IV